jgi:carbonic anhydrase/acetyltransferase-like protein (isoleucine patch superfamily)
VTIGHRAIVHACTIGNRCLIGMGAIVMDRCVIGDDCIVAAGSLVPEGTVVPAGSVVMGSPAKIKRTIHEAEKEWIKKSAENYYELAKTYLDL